MALFENKPFVSHAGINLSFKIECDALDNDDIETLAEIIGKKFSFGRVYGIPTGGLRLASALERFRSSSGKVLIVDDVLTTGVSMEALRREVGADSVGVVIFARGKCPAWIYPIFQLAEWAGP
jgi:orotate phosphoribosyltransferase